MKQKERINEIRELKQALRDSLLAHPDILSLGIGYRIKGGKITDEICLIAGVSHKLPEDKLDAKRLIPKSLTYFSRSKGREITAGVDVQERAVPEPYQCGPCTTDLESRVRPVPGGFSISADGGGTLGGWVWDNISDQTVLLSNNHVLGGTVGENVLQPSSTDGGVPADHFADVLRSGSLDATIAAPIDTNDVSYRIECIGAGVYETTEPTLGMQVEKTGQTTGHTCGTVIQIAVDVGHYGSINDFEVYTDTTGQRFAYYGDSGSLIVERTHPDPDATWQRVVGLLWGGDPSDYNAYAHTIDDVFTDLNLSTVCAGVLSNLTTYGESSIRRKSRKKSLLPGIRGGFARNMEKRLLKMENGRTLVDLLHRERTDIVRLITQGDGQLAVEKALVPILKGKRTTLDVLEHRLTKKDIKNIAKVLEVAEVDHPGMKKSLRFVKPLLKRATNRTIKSLLG
ncbi:MAG: hypothetical protein QNJ78_03000 [Gammaproteobacteria bacterium]|nr:hypothetical protein [Gammaproteobacteria bacterium]